MDINNYKKRYLNKNLLNLHCQACKRDSFENKWYETKNNLFLHIECYEALARYQKRGE